MARPGSDVVVIGGGIVGASCAYFLSTAGASVTLVERDHLASGASGAGQSHISMGIGTVDLDHSRAALRTHAELRERGVDQGYQQTGGLFFAATETDGIELANEAERFRSQGIECKMLDEPQVRDLEPLLAPGFVAAAYEPSGAQINPMGTIMGLASAVVSGGGRLVLGEGVVDLVARSHGWTVHTASGQYPADHVVIAAGAWSREVGRMVGLHLPVWPRKGHILVTEPRPRWLRQFVFEFGYEHSLNRGFEPVPHDAQARVLDPLEEPPDDPPKVGAILQPTPSGQLLIGSSRESAGWDRAVDRSRLVQIAARATHFLPGLAAVRVIRSYAGLRPWSPDGMPLIGRCQRLAGLWLATGHGGSGISGGPLAGRLISQMIADETPVVDVTPFLPDRFGPGIYAAGTRHER